MIKFFSEINSVSSSWRAINCCKPPCWTFNKYIILDIYCQSRYSFLDVCGPSTNLKKLCSSRKSIIHIFNYIFSYFFNKIRRLFLMYITIKINIVSKKIFFLMVLCHDHQKIKICVCQERPNL